MRGTYEILHPPHKQAPSNGIVRFVECWGFREVGRGKEGKLILNRSSLRGNFCMTNPRDIPPLDSCSLSPTPRTFHRTLRPEKQLQQNAVKSRNPSTKKSILIRPTEDLIHLRTRRQSQLIATSSPIDIISLLRSDEHFPLLLLPTTSSVSLVQRPQSRKPRGDSFGVGGGDSLD